MPSRKAGSRAGERFVAFIATVMVLALGVLFDPSPSAAAPALAPALPGQCTVQQWQSPTNFTTCVSKLKGLTSDRLQCLSAPVPETPDSGMPGWFASEPASSKENGPKGLYSLYGYAGYDYTTYDVGCVSPLTHPASSFEDTIANGEFMIATSVVGASDALRERAWDPQSMWGWADPLVDKATKSLYAKVFTVFGSITLGVVGLYLMWRSRQADMSSAMTTAGWAIFVMVIVTAIAAWPVRSAHVADSALVGGLNVVHGAIGPESESTPLSQCQLTGQVCLRRPATACRSRQRYRDGELDLSQLASRVYSDRPIVRPRRSTDAFSTTQNRSHGMRHSRFRQNPATRDATIAAKQLEWTKVAEQIKTEDPQAYSYLKGDQGMDRVGAGFIAILSSLFFSMFDITASILVLIGFLIFRWAVIAAPILGTLGLLRPASSGLRRLANAVIAAVFNIIIFGTGAAVYLYAVDLIMSTTTLPGWLQVVLMWLVGVVGWLLLRPYRRITQLGGKDSTAAVTSVGSWHRRFFRDAREAARLDVVTAGGTAEPRLGRGGTVDAGSRTLRPESRTEDSAPAPAAAPAGNSSAEAGTRRRPAGDWTDPDVPDSPSGYSIYRPESSPPADTPTSRPAHRPESSTVNG